MWKGNVQFKKYISIILSFCMLFTLFPMHTSAIDNDGYGIASDSNVYEVSKEGTGESVSGSLISSPSNADINKNLSSDDNDKLENKGENTDYINTDEIEKASSSNAKEIEYYYQTLIYNNLFISGNLPDGIELDVSLVEESYIENYIDITGFVSAYDINLYYNNDEYEFKSDISLNIELERNYDFIDIYHICDEDIEWYEADVDNNIISFDLISNGIIVLIDPLEVMRTYMVQTLDEDYVYFDLNAGNVVINDSTYLGYIYVDGIKTEVKGDHSDNNDYYVYQSNDDNILTTGLVDGSMIIPEYNSMKFDGESWGDYITNNTNINDIITNWTTSSNEVGRTYTPNYITVTGNLNCDLTIDNIWSSYQQVSEGRTTGGITMTNKGDTDLVLKLKGDNRLGNIYYCSSVNTNSITITDYDGDGKSNNSLTLGNFVTNSGNSHWNSLIGASDNSDNSVGIFIDGGIIWGGTTPKDNCTVIGAGGNGKGVVTINGGTVTAVSNSSGTAIGGGIGYSSYGGDAVVTITGGEIYAYNYGFYVNGEIIPACAIGGGSSRSNTGNKSTTVNISGGDIYAYCVGGTAIGGGGSTTKNGGPATINITGGNIIAISASNNETGVEAGCSIGGGTGGTGGNGGDVILNISGNPILNTGSVGGGKTNNPNGFIGSATVDISGGKINAQFIMASGSEKECSFEMSGGIIDNSNNVYTFLEENGGAVYIEGGTASVLNGEITGCTSNNGGAIYIVGGDFNMSGGIISENISSENGGAVYINGGNVNITGGLIEANESKKSGGGIYVSSNSNDFKVDIYSGSIINNYSGENGGGIGIDVDSSSKVSINIGSEPCLGLDNNHIHPVIENNSSYTHGGGLYLNGDETNITLNMYCGSIEDNFANYERSSDNVSQTGGLLTWFGGYIGHGLCVTGGTLLDEKLNASETDYEITYHPNYLGSTDENKLAIITDGVEICLPAYAFMRDGYYLIGWSEKPNPTSNKDIISIGANYDVLSNKTLYAVWSVEAPSINYIVYIPDKIVIDDSKKAYLDLSVEMSYFPYNADLVLSINKKDKLYLDSNNNIGLTYDLLDGERLIFDGDIITTWSLRNRDGKKLVLELLEDAEFAGIYSDILTFTVNYSE